MALEVSPKVNKNSCKTAPENSLSHLVQAGEAMVDGAKDVVVLVLWGASWREKRRGICGPSALQPWLLCESELLTAKAAIVN